MPLVIIGRCVNCGAEQLDGGRILVDPDAVHKCTTHDFVSVDDGDVEIEIQRSPPPINNNRSRNAMPYREECDANDKLSDHKEKVEGDIDRTNNTIEALESRRSKWERNIRQDFQNVIDEAERTRDRLLAGLNALVQGKDEELKEQLEAYTRHCQSCDDMLNEIFNRTENHPRTSDRKRKIVADAQRTIGDFPRLQPVPIAVAVECQTQPIVELLRYFGAVLESDLGRLPTVNIDHVEKGEVQYTVLESEDDEEKRAVNFIPNLHVEIQTTTLYDRSLGWEVSSIVRVPVQEVSGRVRIDTRNLPKSEKVYVRARTIITESHSANEPIRISRWSEVVETANRRRIEPRAMEARPSPEPPAFSQSEVIEPPDIPPARLSPAPVIAEPQPPPAPSVDKLFVVCVDPKTRVRTPCRAQAPDFIGTIQNAAIRKFKWGCNPQQVKLHIVTKDGQFVTDLSAEDYPNHVLAEVWSKESHLIHAFNGDEAVGNDVQPENIEWPRRLMIRIKQSPAKESPARPSPLKIDDRDQPGGWLTALRRRYCERFSIPEEGEMRFYFVDEDGNRVKEVNSDVDLLYVQENKRVYAVGEAA